MVIKMNNIIYFENSTVNYWIDEFPIEQLNVNNINKTTYKVKNKVNIQKTQQVTLELLLNKNFSNYGMIGVKFTPYEDDGQLQLDIVYTTSNDILYSSSIAPYDEYIYTGLLEYYIGAICDKVNEYLETKAFAYGKLEILISANSEVGSSPKIFAQIMEMIMDLIILKEQKNICSNDDILKKLYETIILA